MRIAFLLLTVLFVFAAPVNAYTLYGYEDEYGVVHLHETKRSDRHALLYSGDKDPKLGFHEIKALIRKKRARSKTRDKKWIAENVRMFGAVVGGGAGTLRFPKVRRSGPIVDLIKRHAKKHRTDPWLVYAVVEQESGFYNAAVSRKGARGLMQLMPETQQTFGVKNPFDPDKNIETGVRFLRAMLDKYGDTRLALAAYNAGPGVVDRCGGVPPIRETMTYVSRVMYRYGMLKEMEAAGGTGKTGKRKSSPPGRS